jgi:D-3-phosphoglycerate dehydrogenase
MTRTSIGEFVILETVHPVMTSGLLDLGFAVVDGQTITRQDILNGLLKETVGVVVRSRFMVDETMMNAMPRLRFIARSGSGLENIDLHAAKARSIHVINSPEGNADAVGEHVIGMMLNLLNRMQSADASVRHGQWEREAHRGLELGARTVGIVGFGVMGNAVAQRLQAFGTRVLAYDKYKQGFEGQHNVQEATMDELRAQCDVVTLHVPLTEETTGFINDEWFNGWNHPITLINAARGPILQTESLRNALQDGRVRAAGLDVLESEGRDLLGLTDHPPALASLMADDRVLFSPHVAGWTVESYVKLATVLLAKLKNHLELGKQGNKETR